MSLLRNRVYLAVVLGHFAVDVFASTGPVLVTFFSVPMALSGAQIGLAIGLFQLISAGTQPVFGWLADKIGSRWLGPVSVVWTASFLALSVFMFQRSNSFMVFMLPFAIAAVGVGAFHPQGTMHAGTSILRRAATGTAVFFLFGQFGLALGPILSGLILDNIGPGGIYLLAVLVIPLFFFMGYAMRHVTVEPHVPLPNKDGSTRRLSVNGEAVRWGAILILAMLTGLRSWAFLGTVAFLPKLFQNMGWDATSYGFITGTYWLASGIFGVVGGNLADRLGRRQIVFVSALAGSMAIFFLPLNNGWLAFPLAITAGGLLGASHSILVVIAQALLPGRKALASGLTLGYMFGVGALAAWAIGVMADIWTLDLVIQVGAGIGLLSALLALLLPTTRQETPQPQAERVAA